MEFYDAYDLCRRPLGYTLPRGELRRGAYRLVTHAYIVDGRGNILLQRRADSKKLMPGKWAFTGGSALPGEDSFACCEREIREELGINPDMSRAAPVISYATSATIVDVFVIQQDVDVADITLHPDEVAEARWFTMDQFRALVDTDMYWRTRCTDMLIRYLEEDITHRSEAQYVR